MMRERYRRGVVLSLLMLAGCNFQAGLTAPSEPSPTPFAIPATYQPSSTPAPEPPSAVPTQPPPTLTAQPTNTPATTLSELAVSPLAGDVTCRFGPGMEYSVEGKISAGVQVRAVGRNGNATWLLVDNPGRPGKLCWAARLELAGAETAEGLPVVAAPVNLITKVTVKLDPTKDEIPCADLPFTFDVTFTLTTTGPLTTRLEADSSEGQALNPTTYSLATSGTFSFDDELKVDAAGDHWYRVDVLSPNVVSGEGKAKLTCTP